MTAAALWLVAAVVISALPRVVAAQSSDPLALKLVEAYNDRNFGNPGWRRVQLELKDGERMTRSFGVINLWRLEGDIVRTLFVLERPERLRGTNYLLVEDPRLAGGMEVHLHLAAGRRRVLTIQPSHFDEGLLGSDFGYRDLRMRIPTAGYRFRVVGNAELLHRRTWIVEAEPVAPETRRVSSWARSRFYLTEDPPLLLAIDRFAASADGGSPEIPVKRMRVEGFRELGGAWTETRIVMLGCAGRSSVLTLEGFRPVAADIDPDFFLAETLPALSRRLPASLMRSASGQTEHAHETDDVP